MAVKSPVRVLHLLWQGNIGGAERAVAQLAQAQKHIPYIDVCVAFGKGEGYYFDHLRRNGVNVIDLSLRSAHDFGQLFKLRKILAQYDVHHFHVAEPLFTLASLFTPSRRLYTYRAGFHTRSSKQILRYKVFGWFLKSSFDGISANTDHAARVAEEIFNLRPQSVCTAYNGLDFGLLAPTLERCSARQRITVDEDYFILGTVANLKPVKRIDWLLRALANLRGEKWKLVIVGDGSQRFELEAIAKELRISDQTLFVGWQEYVADWLIAFDGFVLPSREESFGNAVVEAMALGIPSIVCKDGGGVTEHIVHGHTGWIATGVDGLAEGISYLIRNPEIRKQLGQAGRAAVRQKYSLQNMLLAYNQFYRDSGIFMEKERLEPV